MDREKFIDFLLNKGLTKASVNSRATWVSRVETEMKISIDSIIHDKEKVLDLIENVMSYTSFTQKQRNNFPNGIRYYYEFRTGQKLGTLRDNNRR